MTTPGFPALATADLTLDRVIRDALEAVRRSVDMPVAYLSVFEGDRVRFAYTSTDADPPFLDEGSSRLAHGTFCKGVLDGDIPELVPDTWLDPHASKMDITYDGPVGAVISIPVTLTPSGCRGMFCCLDHVRRPDLKERDHAILSAFASLVTALLTERGADLKRESESREYIQTLIERRDFSLVHQPVVTLVDQKVVLFEALCRFGGFRPAPPDVVFGRARAVGLGPELELSVFERTLANAARLSGQRGLSMNLSPDVVMTDRLMDIIAAAPKIENRIIELTEHVDFGDYDALADRLAELRRRGFRIAIDDFGNGHASLNTVLRLKPEIVKLDRALIAQVEENRASQSLVQAVATFSQEIGAVLVAEGIEQLTQVPPLLRLGVGLGQGYYFGRPQAPAQKEDSSSAA